MNFYNSFRKNESIQRIYMPCLTIATAISVETMWYPDLLLATTAVFGQMDGTYR